MKIKITSLTDQQQPHIHYIFKPALTLDVCKTCSTTLPSLGQELLETHAKKYQDSINIPQWCEIIWGTTVELDNIDFEKLQLIHTTSYEAQAIRQGLITPVKTLGLVGLTHTKDDYFIFGLRTGAAMGGYLCNAPAGHCAPDQPGNNPIAAGFYEELETELGLMPADIITAKIIGYQGDPDFGRGINTVIYAQTTKTLVEIQKLHAAAYAEATQAKKAGCNYIEIQAAIKNSGLKNVDAHEHDLLVGLPATTATLTKLIETRYYQELNFTAPIMDIGRGSLIMYLASNVK